MTTEQMRCPEGPHQNTECKTVPVVRLDPIEVAKETIAYIAEFRERQPQACMVADDLEHGEKGVLARAVVAQEAGIALLRKEHRRAIDAMSEEIAELKSDNQRMQRFIDSSEDLAKAAEIVELYEQNERLRKGSTELLEHLQSSNGASFEVNTGGCDWCREQWVHPKGAPLDDIKRNATRHAFRCTANPLKLERDTLLAQVTELKEALLVACNLHDRVVRFGWNASIETREHEYIKDKITELLALSGVPSPTSKNSRG